MDICTDINSLEIPTADEMPTEIPVIETIGTDCEGDIDKIIETQASTNEEIDDEKPDTNGDDTISNNSSDTFSCIMTEELLKSIDMELEGLNCSSVGLTTVDDIEECDELDDNNIDDVTKDADVQTFCGDDAINALNDEIQKSLEFTKDLSHYLHADVTVDKDLYDLFNYRK